MARLCVMARFSGVQRGACPEHQISQSIHIDRELRIPRNASSSIIWTGVGLQRAGVIAITVGSWEIRRSARTMDAFMCDIRGAASSALS